MTAFGVCAEAGPDERFAVGRDAIHHALVDDALGRALAIQRVAIDHPHGHRLPQTVWSLRVRVDVLAVELEPELARVVGEDVLVVDLGRWPVQKHLLLDAAVLRRIDHRTGVLETIRELQRRIRPIEIDPPRADDRQLRRIHLVGGDAVAADESDPRRFREVCGDRLAALTAFAATAALTPFAAPAALAER